VIGFPKPVKGEYRMEQKRREREHKAREKTIMAAVVVEDGRKCRVPKCATGLRIECAHEIHRGMGGNPDESRTIPEGLIALCVRCHSLYDTGRLEITPKTDQRLRGACEYYLDGKFVGAEPVVRVSVTRSAS